jgi:hypothetical protein
VDDFQTRISFSSGRVYNEELRCVSSLLDIEPGEFSRWPRPSAVIKLQNIISLVSGEIESLFTLETPLVDALKIVQQTLDITSLSLTLGGAFNGGDLPVDQVLLLREICSKIANTLPSNQFTDEAAGILEQLEQISKQLPTAERQDAAMHELSH